MKCITVLAAFLLAFPLFALAAEAGPPAQAGFPSQTIWVSKSSAAEGETVIVSAVVYNEEPETLRGTLVFSASGTRIGVREFELPSGESQIHSVEWKPRVGEYELTARIEGTSASLSHAETPALAITIQEPQLSAAEQVLNETVRTISQITASSAPIVSQTAQTIFDKTERLREAGIERLEDYLASQQSQSNITGFVAGTSTSVVGSNTAAANISEGKEFVSNALHTAAAGALFAMKNVALFYPLLAFLILGILYMLARSVRRP